MTSTGAISNFFLNTHYNDSIKKNASLIVNFDQLNINRADKNDITFYMVKELKIHYNQKVTVCFPSLEPLTKKI